MIVKNESAVIARCLQSVKPLIDSWCIVDTGSSDDTKKIVRATMRDIPGVLHDRPWRDFGTNRTEALTLAFARKDVNYALVIDADDVLEIPENGVVVPDLTEPAYALRIEHGDVAHYRSHVFRRDAGYRYEGVVHEYATNDTAFEPPPIDGIVYRIVGGGSRSALSDKKKYLGDALALRRALAKDPSNARYVFYLAQSYRDAGRPSDAITNYERRASMTHGFREEVFISLIEIARANVKLQAPEHVVVAAYMRAFEDSPHRAEPIFELARYYRSQDRFAAAHVYAKACAGMPRPNDRLFVNDFVYEWAATDELAINAFYVGDFTGSIAASESLLASSRLPHTERARVEKNRDLAVERLTR